MGDDTQSGRHTIFVAFENEFVHHMRSYVIRCRMQLKNRSNLFHASVRWSIWTRRQDMHSKCDSLSATFYKNSEENYYVLFLSKRIRSIAVGLSQLTKVVMPGLWQIVRQRRPTDWVKMIYFLLFECAPIIIVVIIKLHFSLSAVRYTGMHGEKLESRHEWTQ